MVVECAHAFAEVDAAEWDAVAAGSGAPVFYRSPYLSAYERSPLGPVDGWAFLTARDPAGRATAVAPFALQRAADPLGCLYAAYPEAAGEPALLGPVWHCYDGQLAGSPDALASVLTAAREAAARLGAGWYGLINLDRDGPTAAAARELGLPLRHLVDRFRTGLVGLTSYEEFLARLGERARANLRRTARRAADAGITSAVVEDPDYAEIAELCDRTAARFGNGGFYPAATFGAFTEALGDAVHVIELRQRGRLVGVGVCLADEVRFHTWTCGVDYAVEGNASPYALLYAQSVRLAIALGRRVLEGGRGNSVFKLRHGLSPVPLDGLLLPT